MRPALLLACAAGCALAPAAGCVLATGEGQEAQPDAGALGDPFPSADGGADDPGASAPARYDGDQERSPVTASVVERMRAIAAASPAPDPRVFMKVGASGTVSNLLLDCFSSGPVDLDGRGELEATIAYYDQPLAAGSSSWARDTLAAEVGESAVWAISGDPSPLESEIAAVDPRVAVVNYGTNDMNQGASHESALWPFHDNLSRLLDELEATGIIPIVTGLNPRTDSADAARWVPTYDAVTRAIAEARQLPYISLYRANRDLPAMGMSDDGIHGNVYTVDGVARPCLFTASGLAFNYNRRNLLTLEALDDVRRAALEGGGAPAAETGSYSGSGAPEAPVLIDRLPFTHRGDTRDWPHQRIDSYPSCDQGQDESGPEVLYRFEIDEPTALRFLVLTRGEVDVDLHLMASSGADPAACIERAHRILERTLAPGAYTLSVDTFAAGGTIMSGAYSLVAVACQPGDPRCL